MGAAIARKLGMPFDVAVVSKITLPWNTEAGYGSVADAYQRWYDLDETQLVDIVMKILGDGTSERLK